ncbi:MAG: hypothetical protein ABSA81_03625 [Candidatus Bathyarchaeia archaeon]
MHEVLDIVRPAGAEVKVHVVSAGLNPFPETVTTVPTGPDEGVKVILDFTMKLAVGASEPAVTVTV